MDETERILLEEEIREALMEMARAERSDDRAEASENFMSAVSQAHAYGAHVLIFRDSAGVMQVSVVTDT